MSTETLVEVILERLSAARRDVVLCEKALRALEVDELLIQDGLVQKRGDTIRYEAPLGMDIPPPNIRSKKRGPYKVVVRRKKVRPDAIASNLEKASRETTTRADILTVLKLEPLMLDGLAGKCEVSTELARYHVKKLIGTGQVVKDGDHYKLA